MLLKHIPNFQISDNTVFCCCCCCFFFCFFRYKGYFEDTYPYKRSGEYWNILAARLAFVLIFQFVVYSITAFIAWIIPDIPEELKFKMKKEKELEKAILRDENNANV